MKRVKYLILGNGIAGYAAAKEIRGNDKDGEILIVGNESYNTYYRMRLTAILAEDFEPEELLVSDDSWYEENDIEVLLNMRAETIDTDKKVVVLDDSQIVEYEKLLIAVGSRPFIPPITGNYKKGLFALRSIDDVKYVQEYLEDREKIFVIGGGLLGLEAAYSLKKLGKDVSIIDRGENLLSRQLDKELSERLEKTLKDEGFTIYLDLDTEEVLGDDVVEGVRLDDGQEVEMDAILVSTGVRSDLDLVRDTKIDCGRGIIVDKSMKTNVEDVFAAGDVVEVDGITLGLWTASNEQGKIVGRNMTGGNETYDIPKLFATTNLGGTRIFSAGDRGEADTVYVNRDEEAINKLFVKDGRIVASMIYGAPSKMTKFRNGTFDNVEIDKFLEENDWKDEFNIEE